LKIPANAGLGFNIGVIGDNIVTGSIIAYELSFYSIEGKEFKKIKKDIKNLFLAFSGQGKAGIAGWIDVPFKITDNYYLSVLVCPTNVTEVSQLMKDGFVADYATTIDIFTEAGSLVYSIKTEGMVNPEIGKPIYSDSEGYLYTFKELPYPQICKYQVIISDKK
jgi:hypothetical protein